MTLQQWCFSFSGRLGRRDFWIWIGVWLVSMLVLFSAAAEDWLALRSAAFGIVALLWPTAAVIVKRLHDRNRSGWWLWMLAVAWLLAAGNWAMLSPLWQWSLERVIPMLIGIAMLLDCGVFLGTHGKNRFGPPAQPVRLRG